MPRPHVFAALFIVLAFAREAAGSGFLGTWRLSYDSATGAHVQFASVESGGVVQVWEDGTTGEPFRANNVRMEADRLSFTVPEDSSWRCELKRTSADRVEGHLFVADRIHRVVGRMVDVSPPIRKQTQVPAMPKAASPPIPKAASSPEDNPESAWREAALQGDVQAQVLLGRAYAEGKGVTQNDEEATKWFRAAALQGDVKAQMYLACAYASGKGLPRDDAEAAKWFYAAALQGEARAQWSLGFAYNRGMGVPENASEAVRWFHSAALQGDSLAQWTLGGAYRLGRGVPADELEAAKWFRQAVKQWRDIAIQGHALAQSLLGNAYELGCGVPQDHAEAAKWWREAALLGNVDAQASLGFAYYEGKGVEWDEHEAVKWWRMAALQGDAQAQVFLATTYEWSREEFVANKQARLQIGPAWSGVKQDPVEAARWWRAAALQGVPRAQQYLGRAYAEGKGVPKDFAEAAKWWSLAYTASAEFMAWSPLPTFKSDEEAIQWWREAYEQGHRATWGSDGQISLFGPIRHFWWGVDYGLP